MKQKFVKSHNKCPLIQYQLLRTYLYYYIILRYFNFKPSSKLRWCPARDLFGSQSPVTTGGFELQVSCIQSRYGLMSLYARDSQLKPSCGYYIIAIL